MISVCVRGRSSFSVARSFASCVSRRRLSTAPAVFNKEHGKQHESSSDKTSHTRKHYAPLTTIFSGIQPTGVPHLGNYLGAIRQWKQFQDEKTRKKDSKHYRLIYSIVDLHALTHHQEPAELLKRRKETYASLLAIGLDPKYSAIFFQSEVPGHSQLMWYLSTVASTGYLSRMTQWKSKLGVAEDATIDDQAARERLRLGLFSYPVLQAADILLYGANIVPVGEDQQQHVEFARSLGRSFNAQYREANNGKDFFTIPNAVISPAKRIMSLKDPMSKMSKSHSDPNSRVLITDSPEDIRTKIKGALTDSVKGISYDTDARPGVSNLIEILKHVTASNASCQEIASAHQDMHIRVFKEHVAEEIVKALAGFRDVFLEKLHSTDHRFDEESARSRRFVASLAGKKISNLEILMGLREKRMKPTQHKTFGSERNRETIKREQQEEEEAGVAEPDVTPQGREGVDRPLAS